LDALGTLLELRPPAPRLRRELHRRFGIEVSQPLAERAIAAEIAYYRAHLEEGRDEVSLAALRGRCAEVLARELELAPGAPAPGGPEMVEALLASLQFSVFADVPNALAELKGRGVRLVVVSNWDVSLADVLGRLGVTRWLDGVVNCAEVGVRKPDPAVFERGLALAGVGPAQALHVGDSPDEDVQGALGAGIEPVLITREGRDRRASSEGVIATIRSLRELPPLVFA
jgi:putative hydrolase of the HAD superfamily